MNIIRRIVNSDLLLNLKFRLQGNGWRTESFYRDKGCKVGENSHIISSSIDLLFPELVTIGDNCTLTGVTLLTHDASTKKKFGYTKFGKVSIGDNVFIGRNTVIMPCVTIGSNVIIGGGSVVTRDIPDDSVAVGVPCKRITSYTDFMARKKKNIDDGITINKMPKELTTKEKKSIMDKMANNEEIYLR